MTDYPLLYLCRSTHHLLLTHWSTQYIGHPMRLPLTDIIKRFLFYSKSLFKYLTLTECVMYILKYLKKFTLMLTIIEFKSRL